MHKQLEACFWWETAMADIYVGGREIFLYKN